MRNLEARASRGVQRPALSRHRRRRLVSGGEAKMPKRSPVRAVG